MTPKRDVSGQASHTKTRGCSLTIDHYQPPAAIPIMVTVNRRGKKSSAVMAIKGMHRSAGPMAQRVNLLATH